LKRLPPTPIDTEDLLFAQSLLEYGAISSMGSGLQAFVSAIEAWIEDAGATTWILIAVVLVVGLKLLTRRS
jgi:hypothetical protein